MISLEEIRKFYASDMQLFDRGLLREYLQYEILSIIFSHKLGRKLSFLGGTCLRIVYGTNRFSEDIDFDNKDLTTDEFDTLSMYVKSELEKIGYKVEITTIHKLAFHCKIKFPQLLSTYELSSLSQENILIQIDTFDQGVNYQTQTYILNKFDITKPIIVTPKSVILSQKLWTITQRKRAKGRDFYDIAYLVQHTKPDSAFLQSKFGTSNMDKVKEEIQKHVVSLDFEYLAQDVKPFLASQKDLDKVIYFKELFDQYNFG